MYIRKKKEITRHLSNNYKSLARLIGEPLEYIEGLTLYAEPESVKIIADYPKTVLVEFGFNNGSWGETHDDPCYIRYGVSKAALAIGEVKFVCQETREPVFGSTIADYFVQNEDGDMVREEDALLKDLESIIC